MPALPRMLFSALNALAGYLVYLNLTPPHPITKRTDTVQDTFGQRWTFLLVKTYRICYLVGVLWQALYILRPSAEQPPGSLLLAPRPRGEYPLNATSLTPNLISVSVLVLICTFASIRLRAFRSLEKDFTFDLRVPQKLNTSGLYAYVQHPGYSAGFVAISSSMFWFMRCDGVGGTILPEWMMRTQGFWNWFLPGLGALSMGLGLLVRTVQEEKMLKQAFGREWEVWHKKTARFIPGIF